MDTQLWWNSEICWNFSSHYCNFKRITIIIQDINKSSKSTIQFYRVNNEFIISMVSSNTLISTTLLLHTISQSINCDLVEVLRYIETLLNESIHLCENINTFDGFFKKSELLLKFIDEESIINPKIIICQ